MEFVNWLASQFSSIANMLNRYTFAGVGLFSLLMSFIVVSIFISVYWRGGRG